MYHRSLLSFVLLSLGACAYPLNGEWEGVEQLIIVDGEVSEKRVIPYEECFNDINQETGEQLEGTTTCVDRGFSLVVDEYESVFTVTNSLNDGQEVQMVTKTWEDNTHVLTDQEDFQMSCVADKQDGERILDCDFTSTIGYLSNSRLIFVKQ